MNKSLSRKEYVDDCCCSLNTSVTGNFRRSSSLRLRGEKMVQRSPLSARKHIPVITENHQVKQHHVAQPANHRPRSHSFSSNAVDRFTRPGSKSQQKKYKEQSSSVRDSGTTPPGSPEDLLDDDSLNSYGSASMDAAFAPFNGTTFSGRSMRYVLHCSTHAGQGEEYLTPTQRATRQIRHLKSLLNLAKTELEKKDSEIFHLTKEVVELKLYKASLISPDEKSNSSEIITIRENTDEDSVIEDVSPKHDGATGFDVADGAMFKDTPTRGCNSEMQGSFTDSGHFEDLANLSLHSKECIHIQTHDASCMTDPDGLEQERLQLISLYEKKIDDIMRAHAEETQELKKQHNDKVEALLQKLSDGNSRMCELLPSYEVAKQRIHELELQLEELMKQLKDEESRHSSMYLQMYNKGVQAAKFDNEKTGDIVDAHGTSSRVSMDELLQQLQITQTELENVRDTAYTSDQSAKALLSAKEAVSLWVLGARKAMYRRIVDSQRGKGSVDPEITLQFLKSAIYYFLTDPDHHQGHLAAIENILGFTEAEKEKIRKARSV